MDQLTCQICGDKLAFNPECPCSLGEHLLSRHPELEMAHFSREDLFCRCSSERIPQDHAPKKKPSPSVRFRTKSRSGQALFKTTVETWRPGPRMVTCPQCNYLERPCIRKQRNRVS
ncbi:uncharacterized protein LOC132707542 [Cylas formicarius]|uniref:uncharacterized protein LOC132707542 n=1 Tax=Cylas formicarius TaxID=197179 RepID=UPI002958DA5D|nr:uncharacterized protein LOC132707542 [Cylas formicarius]